MLTVCMFPCRIKDNAAIEILAEACERQDVRYVPFDWFWCSMKPCDVFHVHWPEAAVMGRGTGRAGVKTLLFLFCVLMFKLRRKPILYSVHNIGSNDGRFPALERLIWALFIPCVTVFQHFNRDSVKQAVARWPRLATAQHCIIPHPNYRSWAPHRMDRAEARARLGISPSSVMLLNFGRMRPYKGVETLIDAFRSVPDPRCVLVIAGLPLDDTYGRTLQSLCAGDPRIRLMARFVPQDELTDLIAASDVVVIAHNKLNNSGVAVTALSADRPILAPARGAILDYAEGTCRDWVTLFHEQIGPAEIAAAVARWASLPEGATPDLSFCDADVVGSAFKALYVAMVAGRRLEALPVRTAGGDLAF